jgi:hypothetical protein
MVEDRRHEFTHLFAEAVDSYVATPTGQEHLALYSRQREEARRNLEDILARRNRGEDVADAVLFV